MSTNLVRRDSQSESVERVVIMGDLAKLSADERLGYYKAVCESIGLNPLTRPFDYITLNGKLTLYARKDATDQLRAINQISVTIQAREVTEGCFVVTARAATPAGRTDESIGAVSIDNLKGEARCNAMMKAETKAKRRVTLSISGLGILDESELESIPESRKKEVALTTEDIPLTGAKHGASDKVKGVDAPNPSERVLTEVQEPPTEKTTIEYIATSLQANFHREFRSAVPKHLKLQADDLCYQWLTTNGYVNEKKEPTAAMIPMSGWTEIWKKACAWVSSL